MSQSEPKRRFSVPEPSRRPLKIYSTDPLVGSEPSQRITLDIPNEKLVPGPAGSRIQVIDYDGVNKIYYPPVNLDDPAILMQNGLEPSESDPRFHQQMVYAVSMKVLENFDRALGRRVTFHRNRPLRLFPHAYNAPNAYYHPKTHAIYFGYFQASRSKPGQNLPGQLVFSCLSHDIIAHEVTHALVTRLRRYFNEASNEDVLAFHEGFSDIIALFQHFSYVDILKAAITKTGGDLKTPGLLVNLAEQFGQAMGTGKALRSALSHRSKALSSTISDEHERGSILVAAVFDAFFQIYQKRIRDLIRISTRGATSLPETDLHPDLVNRIANEAARTASDLLTICIRAFDYLPPVDITFGDYLRALVTADYELSPSDEFGVRACIIDAFRNRHIYPVDVQSLAEESLIWRTADEAIQKKPIYTGELRNLLAYDWSSNRWWEGDSRDKESDSDWEVNNGESDDALSRKAHLRRGMYGRLYDYATRNAKLLHLDPGLPIRVHGFQWVMRMTPNRELHMEFVAQFTQHSKEPLAVYGGIPLRGGTTIIARPDGVIRYVISKPLPTVSSHQRPAKERRDRQLAYAEQCKMTDLRFGWRPQLYAHTYMVGRMNFLHIHQGLMR